MMEQQMKVQQDQKVRKGLSGSTLKLIAIFTMLIDHIGASIIERGILMKYNAVSAQDYVNLVTNNEFFRNMYLLDLVMRMIGRLAFPIFCFLLIEGFLHTHNVKKYVLRMLAFCFISEIPFDMAFAGKFFYFSYQNVFFTLLIGLLVLIGLSKINGKKWSDILLKAVVIVVGMSAAQLLKTDYGAFGVAFIVIMYSFRNNELLRNIFGCLSISWEITAPLSFIFIHFYNGKRGFNLKYVFYLFYPVHLLILGAITIFLM